MPETKKMPTSDATRHFHKIYVAVDEDGKELLGTFLTDGREVRLYVSSDGKDLTVYVDGKEAKVAKCCSND